MLSLSASPNSKVPVRNFLTRNVAGAFLITSVLTLAGCALPQQHDLRAHVTGEAKAPIPAKQVAIYAASPVAYKEIAQFSAYSMPSYVLNDTRRIDEVVSLLQEEAAKLGANAVVLSNLDHDLVEVKALNHISTGANTSVKENRHVVYVKALAVYVPEK